MARPERARNEAVAAGIEPSTAALLEVAKGAGRQKFEEGFAKQLALLDTMAIAERLLGIVRDYATQATFDAKGLVLLCFEDLRKGGDIYCHRTQVARWLYETYAVKVEELPE